MRPASVFEPSLSPGVPVASVVVVDPRYDAYSSLAASARQGKISLHMRSNGGDALRLSRKLHVDAWLIAAELDDMAGHDLVELLKAKSLGSPMAMVVDGATGRHHALDTSAALESGADAALKHPITLDDLERLLKLPTPERIQEFLTDGVRRPFVTLPVGLGAAAVAIAVLMIG